MEPMARREPTPASLIASKAKAPGHACLDYQDRRMTGGVVIQFLVPKLRRGDRHSLRLLGHEEDQELSPVEHDFGATANLFRARFELDIIG